MHFNKINVMRIALFFTEHKIKQNLFTYVYLELTTHDFHDNLARD